MPTIMSKKGRKSTPSISQDRDIANFRVRAGGDAPHVGRQGLHAGQQRIEAIEQVGGRETALPGARTHLLPPAVEVEFDLLHRPSPVARGAGRRIPGEDADEQRADRGRDGGEELEGGRVQQLDDRRPRFAEVAGAEALGGEVERHDEPDEGEDEAHGGEIARQAGHDVVAGARRVGLLSHEGRERPLRDALHARRLGQERGPGGDEGRLLAEQTAELVAGLGPRLAIATRPGARHLKSADTRPDLAQAGQARPEDGEAVDHAGGHPRRQNRQRHDVDEGRHVDQFDGRDHDGPRHRGRGGADLLAQGWGRREQVGEAGHHQQDDADQGLHAKLRAAPRLGCCAHRRTLETFSERHPLSNCTRSALGSGLNQHQKATTAASAMAEALRSSLS